MMSEQPGHSTRKDRADDATGSTDQPQTNTALATLLGEGAFDTAEAIINAVEAVQYGVQCGVVLAEEKLFVH